MISINTNLSSLIAQQSLKQSSNKLNQAVERMSTGFKINHAKDNAANYSISTNMTTKIGAYQVAEDNVAMGLDLLSTANGSLDQISDKLSRLRALAEQSANGTYGAQSRSAINAEANALVDEIERLYNTTEYNGINLAKGKVIGTEESKFIKDIDRRDTSKMTTLESVDITQKLDFGSYSISTPEELAKLATMTNNGLIGAGTEFVLANDIDLSGYSNWTPIGTSIFAETEWVEVGGNPFRSIFDGNGYVISNLTIDSNNAYQGLFGYIEDSIIKNVGLEDVSINVSLSNGRCVGALAASVSGYSSLENLYVTGDITTNGISNVGGLVGYVRGYYHEDFTDNISCASSIDSCYVDASITTSSSAGGLLGAMYNGSVKNCYTTGELSIYHNGAGIVSNAEGINGQTFSLENCYTEMRLTRLYTGRWLHVAGLIAVSYSFANSSIKISNSHVYTDSSDLTEIFVGRVGTGTQLSINNASYSSNYDSSGIDFCSFDSADSPRNLNYITSIQSGEKPLQFTNDGCINNYDDNLSLQIGCNSEISSQINVSTGYVLNCLLSIRNIGFNNSGYLSQIDDLLNEVSIKQTELGATQNRLESALDEISTQYENLVSSRSTLRDADIIEVSSEYIRQQILQEASATLLATANQSPSIALQLL